MRRGGMHVEIKAFVPSSLQTPVVSISPLGAAGGDQIYWEGESWFIIPHTGNLRKNYPGLVEVRTWAIFLSGVNRPHAIEVNGGTPVYAS